jgi:hypothetical protein
LDGVLGLVDALLVFQDAPAEEWTEMAKLSFGKFSHHDLYGQNNYLYQMNRHSAELRWF